MLCMMHRDSKHPDAHNLNMGFWNSIPACTCAHRHIHLHVTQLRCCALGCYAPLLTGVSQGAPTLSSLVPVDLSKISIGVSYHSGTYRQIDDGWQSHLCMYTCNPEKIQHCNA